MLLYAWVFDNFFYHSNLSFKFQEVVLWEDSSWFTYTFCSSIFQTQGSSHEVKLFERMEYGGQMMALVEDCPDVMDMFQTNHIFSCKVIGGNWLFFENSNYRGRMYLIRPGEYTRFTEWGGTSARVGSIKRIMDY